MASLLGSLLVSLGLDSAEFTSGLTKAEYAAQKMAQQMSAAFTGLASKAGVALSVAGIAAYVDSLISAADRMHDLSVRTQTSVEDLGGIGLAAEKSGSSMESMASLIGRMNVKIGQAAGGSGDAAKAFAAMGISVIDSNDKVKSTVTVLGELADKFNTYEEGPAKASLAQKAFSRSYQEVLPLLKLGSAGIQESMDYYKKFGGTTTEVARQADEFKDALVDIKFLATQTGRALLIEMLPPLQQVAKALKDFLQTNDSFKTFVAGLSIGFKALVTVAAGFALTLDYVGRALSAIAAMAMAGDSKSNPINWVKSWFGTEKDGQEIRKSVSAQIKTINAAWEEGNKKALQSSEDFENKLWGRKQPPSIALTPRQLLHAGEFDPGPKLQAPKVGEGGGGDGKGKVSEAEKYLQALEKQVVKTLELTAAEQIEFDLRKGLQGMTAPLKAGILAAKDELERNRLLEDEVKAREKASAGWTAYADKVIEADFEATEAHAKRQIAAAENIKTMEKSNEVLAEEISLLGKSSQERAAAQAKKIEKEQIVPREATFAALKDMGGEEAEDTRVRLQEEIKVLREQIKLTLGKADAENALELKLGNKALSEEIDLLGLDEKARAAYNKTLIETTIATKMAQAASQDATAEGVARKEALEEEIKLLRERLKLTGIKVEKQAGIDLKAAGEAASKTMAESIAEGIMDGFRKGTSFADIFIRELKAQFAKTILTPIIQPMVKEGNDIISGLLKGLIGSMAGAPTGGADAGMIGSEAWLSPGKAGGGTVDANTLYRVNDAGRTEALKLNGQQFLLMGSKGGNIDSSPRSNGAPVINQVLNVGQGVTRSELFAAMNTAKNQALAEISRSMKQNSSFAMGA